jgi:hypothetical protein
LYGIFLGGLSHASLSLGLSVIPCKGIFLAYINMKPPSKGRQGAPPYSIAPTFFHGNQSLDPIPKKPSMSSSSTFANPLDPLVGIAISEKLSKTNHAMWMAQILTAVMGARLVGHLTDDSPTPVKEITTKVDNKDVTTSNPEFEEWYAKDQQVLSFVLINLGREALLQVSTKEVAAEAWETIEEMFSSQTRARVVNTCLALATTQKGNMTVA